MPEISGISVPFVPISGIQQKQQSPLEVNAKKSNFDKVFADELSKIKISGHAKARMNSRNINLSDMDMLRLESAVSRADTKNVKESLILLDNKAFIVNIPNKTVVTMMEKQQMQENVVTNIDSAVFA